MASKGTTETDTTRSEGIRKAYALATTWLREENKDRFKELQVKAAAQLGIEWSPRLSAEERDEQTIRDLFDKNPGLREKVLDDSLTNTPSEPSDTRIEKGL